MQRFRSRRRELGAGGSAHPQADIADEEIEAVVVDAQRRLGDMASSRGDVPVIDLTAADPYGRMMTALPQTASGAPIRHTELPHGP